MKSNCPKKIVLEGFSLHGKFPDDVEDHVLSCAGCQEKLRLWNEERGDFLQKYPFWKLWNAIESKKKNPRFWERFFVPPPFRTALALATIAGLMVFAVWQYRQPPIVISKGGVGLGFYYAHEGQARRGEDRMTLTAGDDLQFVYSSTQERYLILFGLEADGTLTIYYPAEGRTSAAIETGQNKKLPSAVRWEPRSSYERFFTLFSKEPVSLEEVKTALASANYKSIEELSRFPLPYPQASVIVYRK